MVPFRLRSTWTIRMIRGERGRTAASRLQMDVMRRGWRPLALEWCRLPVRRSSMAHGVRTPVTPSGSTRTFFASAAFGCTFGCRRRGHSAAWPEHGSRIRGRPETPPGSCRTKPSFSRSRRGTCMQRDERGSALVLVLLCATLFLALGGALVTLASTDATISATFRESAAALAGAEAALARVMADLTTVADWNAALTGRAISSFQDGPDAGSRRLP